MSAHCGFILISLSSFPPISSHLFQIMPSSPSHAHITVKLSGRFRLLFSRNASFHPKLPNAGMFIIFLCRYMGFPLTDQPSTDISRYFYIASKFIENGINSGGEDEIDCFSENVSTNYVLSFFQEKSSSTVWSACRVRQPVCSRI